MINFSESQQKIVDALEDISDNATVCDIEQIRAEIEKHTDGNNHCDEYIDGYNDGMKDALGIIDKYTKGDKE